MDSDEEDKLQCEDQGSADPLGTSDQHQREVYAEAMIRCFPLEGSHGTRRRLGDGSLLLSGASSAES